MTDIEIDRRLALAVGYTADRVRTIAGWTDVYNKPFERLDGPYAEDGWQRFDHKNPAVIWPIAERFNAFPKRQYNGACEFIGWHTFSMCRGYGANENPATASALSVIDYVEGQK